MTQTRRIAAAAVALVTTMSVRPVGQSTDPLVGTWELNVAKSVYRSGPAPKSETRTYAVNGSDIQATSKGMGPDGKPTTGQWTVNYDGRDRAVAGDANVDSLALKRIDALTTEFTQKKNGKIVSTGRRAIAKDGRTMTITTKGTNAKGLAYEDVEVFEKIGRQPTAASAARGVSTTGRDLARLENDWAVAVQRRDGAFLEQLYADDYLFTDQDGVVWTKAQDIGNATSGALRFDAFRLEDLKVHPLGEVAAVVTGANTIKASFKGKDISGTYRFSDTFVKRDGRWQVVATQSTLVAGK